MKKNGRPKAHEIAASEKKLAALTETEIAWIAGFLEGEGYFSRTKYSRPQIAVVTTDKDVAQKLAKMLDANVRSQPAPKNPNHKQAYMVRTCGKQLVGLLERILPMMGNRRRQAIRLALKVQ